ncbi:cysteine proteinase [Auriculariales sp. MPI-PUGE-AT-0066]|nr:cysteine proteinase [Auriculariales sp. MPI-PUGE-AT-0066]
MSAAALRVARATATRAANKELERDLDAAFENYIAAARAFLSLANTYPALNDTARAEANKALERAEKIKRAKQNVRPVAREAFSADEQQHVLAQSSRVFGSRYSRWSSDSPNIEASDSQNQPAIDVGAPVEWRRAASVMPNGGLLNYSLEPQSVAQTVTGNCSVVASIAVCVRHQISFGSKLLLSSLYPQNQAGDPITSDNGCHSYKMLLNGTYREVVIDDLLPTNAESGELLCATTGSKQVFWPLLVEKAYMKAMGGYMFDGSNSSIDLHALIGWIPEPIHLAAPGLDKDRLFDRILGGFASGHCLLTLGTGKTSGDSVLASLIPLHDYAVLDVTQDGLLRISDPLSKTAVRQQTLSWDEVCAHFDSIYLSWDPTIYSHTQLLHGYLTSFTSEQGPSLNHRIRVAFSADSTNHNGDELLVLLTRHFPPSKDTPLPFVAIHALENSLMSSKDTRQLAARVALPLGDGLITFVASRQAPAAADGDNVECAFSLSLFCGRAVSIVPEPSKPLYTKKIEASFNSRNAGGSPLHSTFMNNPQWCLKFQPGPREHGRNTKSLLRLTVEASRGLPLNITVVWGSSKRITDIIEGDVVLDSGTYRYGLASVNNEVEISTYTIIVSAFAPKSIGPFSLTVESSIAFALDPIAQEGSGMYESVERGSWSLDTAGGGPSSGRYHLNPRYELNMPSPTRIIARLQLATRLANAALNLTVFTYDPKTKTLGREVATSGAYAESLSGALIPETNLPPGRYVLVPSTYATGVRSTFRLVLFSSIATVKPVLLNVA